MRLELESTTTVINLDDTKGTDIVKLYRNAQEIRLKPQDETEDTDGYEAMIRDCDLIIKTINEGYAEFLI